jgi:SAM-dependent methyltransferase
MYDEERAQAEQMTAPGFVQEPDCWAQRAGHFASAARRVPQPDYFMQFLLPHLHPTDTVIDIGAGTGRYEPTLAGAVAQVLAVEPSPAMRSELERLLVEQRLDRVHIVPESWPDADVPQCDVAIAAHVLYGVREIAPFLQRMDMVARRACFLLLSLQHPAAFISAFWERLRGVARLPLPGALECLNVLHQIGIPAQLSLIPVSSRFRYADHQEALDDIRWRLRFPADAANDAAIAAAIADLLERDENGRLVPRDQSPYTAVIWWTHEATSGGEGA